MLHFSYRRPTSLDEACLLLAQLPGSRPVAGGTDLMVQVRENSPRWQDLSCVIDLTALSELRGIWEENGMVYVGATTTHAQAQSSPVLGEHAPLLVQACATVGSPQIRNRGTLGGAVGNASPASDPLPALLALEARVVVQSVRGTRTLPVEEVVAAPAQTALERDEIITGFTFSSAAELSTAFVKLGRRKALSISRMNVAAVAAQDETGAIVTLRIVPGCVFSTPRRVPSVERRLLGKRPDPALLEQAGQCMAEEMVRQTGVRWSTEYKQPVIQALTRRALEAVLEVAR